MKRKFTSLLLTACLLAGMVFTAPRALAVLPADAAVKIECAAGYFYYDPATEAVVKGTGTGNNVSGTLDLTAVEEITIREIDDFAFQNNRELTSVKLPGTVTTIGDYAFSGCDKLTGIQMAGVIALGNGAFNGCISFETTLTKDVQSIGDGAFSGAGKIFIDLSLIHI